MGVIYTYIYIYIYYNPVTLLLDTLSPSTNSSGRFWVSNRVSPGRALHIDVQLPAKNENMIFVLGKTTTINNNYNIWNILSI